MHGLSAPAFWLLRRLTGLRLYHLLALLVVLTIVVGGMAVPFWWLGERADAAIGAFGFVLVAIAYLYAALLVLAATAVILGRLLVGRVRRLFA
ncbi:MAG TPA: hypothetical protein VNZ01_10850 [Solirubrobacteraceae bacterium]|nr:hypothetical protein [Solirubrobacteraceae bacterium]